MSKPNQTIEAVLLNRVKVIGDNEWKLTGTPDDLMKELEVAISSIVYETIGEYEAVIDATGMGADAAFDGIEQAARNQLKSYQRQRARQLINGRD